jgi:hypothetical protein
VYNTVAKHIQEGRLKPRRGGGYSQGAVDQYARGNLKRRPDWSEAQDAPVKGNADTGEPGAAELKAQKQAKLIDIEAERKAFKFRQEQGELVEKALFERELSARARSFRYGLENYVQGQVADEIAALFGGDTEAALEIIRLVSGDEEQAAKLVAWCEKRKAELVAVWKGQVEGFLEPYTSDAWWTKEMQEAMEGED